MTEQEWVAATDASKMLEFVREKVSDRKLRLFACACCCSFAHLKEQKFHLSLAVALRRADGLADAADLQSARSQASGSVLAALLGNADLAAAGAATETAWAIAHDAARAAGMDPNVRGGIGRMRDFMDNFERSGLYAQTVQAEQATQARLLHDLMGNPFHPVTLNPSCRTATVTSLAQAIYDDRQLPAGLFDNQRMGVLGDALEEAGCDNADILNHCRSGGKHVRGCWLVDAILGKE